MWNIDKRRQKILRNLPKPWEGVVQDFLEGRESSTILLSRCGISEGIQQFHAGNELSQEVINNYICLVRNATDGQRQILMGTKFLSGTGIVSMSDAEGVTAINFNIFQKLIIPIIKDKECILAVIKNESDGIHLVYYSMSHQETPISGLQTWIRSVGGRDAPIFVERHDVPRLHEPRDSSRYILLALSLEAFECRHLSHEELIRVIPRAGNIILGQLLAAQLEPNQADLDALRADMISFRSASVSSQSPTIVTVPVPRVNPGSVQSRATSEVIIVPVAPKRSHDGRPRKRTRSGGNLPSETDQSIPDKYAWDFANDTVLKKLAPVIYTLNHPPQDHVEFMGSSDLPLLWASRKCSSGPMLELLDRVEREHFSRTFYERIEKTRLEDGTYIGQKLGVLQHANEQAGIAKLRAAKSAIWSDLINLVEPFLGRDAHVALSAIPASTSAMESMNKSDKKRFILIMDGRINDPNDNLQSRLVMLACSFNSTTAPNPRLEENMEYLLCDEIYQGGSGSVFNLCAPSFLNYVQPTPSGDSDAELSDHDSEDFEGMSLENGIFVRK